MVPVANQASMLQDQSRGSLALAALAAPNTHTGEMERDASAAKSREEDANFDADPPHEDEERWDGRVWTEEELGEFLEMETTAVVQVGKEFFDAEGIFLYRI